MDLQTLFPSVTQRGNTWNSPCPMCIPDSTELVYQGFSFYGEDRLVWFVDTKTFYCRECARNGLGRGGNGYYKLVDISNKLGTSADIDSEVLTKPKESPLLYLWDDFLINRAHLLVEREYWKQFGWGDSLINKFKLGKGTLVSEDGVAHVIPMRIERIFKNEEDDVLGPIDLYYIAARKQGVPPKRNPGSVKNFWWRIPSTTSLPKGVVLAEGEKDAITLSYMFPEYDVITAFGASSWTEVKSSLLVTYKSVIVFGDYDTAGQSFNDQLMVHANKFGFTLRFMDWGKTGMEQGSDITDLFSIHKEASRLLVEKSLQVFVSTYQPPSLIHSPVEGEESFVTVDELRGAGERSLTGIIEGYLTSYEPGEALLLAAPPGVGKTFTLVRTATGMAKQGLELDLVALARLREEEASLRKQLVVTVDEELRKELADSYKAVQAEIEGFSFARIAWYGQYRDGFTGLLDNGMSEEICFDYRARDANNCSNFELVVKLGSNNHVIGEYCSLGCPFKASCEAGGYLSQERRRKEKPITYFRHQHLTGELPNEYTRLTIVDENPSHVIDGEPLFALPVDLVNHQQGWDIDISDYASVEALTTLTRVLRMVCGLTNGQPARFEDGVKNPMHTISGSAVLKLIDSTIKSLGGDQTLDSVLSQINPKTLDKFQPTFISGDSETIRKRCVGEIYRGLVRELPRYQKDGDNQAPTCLHLTGGGIELYAASKFGVPKSSPLIVADATAFPDLYSAMFANREIKVFEPLVRNPLTKTTVIVGSDWTKGQLMSELGEAIRAMKRVVPTVTTLLGEEIRLDAAPNTENLESTMLRHAKIMLKYFSVRHKQTLVVTHKDLRGLFETLFPYENISYAHYGQLRGSNAYQSYEAVCLIGAFRIPYDIVWKKVQAWASLLGLEEHIPNETVVEDIYFPDSTEISSHRTFKNPFAKKFVTMIEVGELVQSAERIRPHTNQEGEKHVYISASRPGLRYGTRFVSKAKFLEEISPESKQSNIRNELLREAEESYKKMGVVVLPSYAVLAKKYGVSFSTIKEHRTEAIIAFETRLTGGGETK